MTLNLPLKRPYGQSCTLHGLQEGLEHLSPRVHVVLVTLLLLHGFEKGWTDRGNVDARDAQFVGVGFQIGHGHVGIGQDFGQQGVDGLYNDPTLDDLCGFILVVFGVNKMLLDDGAQSVDPVRLALDAQPRAFDGDDLLGTECEGIRGEG